MAELASLWIGKELGCIEVASLQSMLRYGDCVTVFSPQPLDKLPKGVAWRDANEIFPSQRILRYTGNGSPAIHANLFRYALLEKTNMVWVDLDIIALRPFDYSSPWIFGYEDKHTVNNAVLRLPKDSETLRLLRKFRPDTVGFPPFMTGIRRLKYKLRTFGRGMSIERWPWGATGPRALTYYLRLTGEIEHALPASDFYATPQADTEKFLIPNAVSRATLPRSAYCAHLWGKDLRALLNTKYNGRVPEGSFLDLALRGAL